MKRRTLFLSLTLAFLASAMSLSAQQATSPLDNFLNALTMRNIGPFRPGAWVTTIAVPDAPLHEHLYTIWAGARSGGVWKSSNGGTTWDPVFDSMGVAPIGAIAVAHTDANIVWVGTGDQANARSSYSGHGVYKSTDGGKSWAFMGLPESHHIARIVINPTNPNIVYVAAMGHLFSRNEERGVFKTTDGGGTWKKVLYVDDHTGAIDLVINAATPNILYAAMYDKERFPWRLIESGPGTGIYRSTDAGEKWQRLTGGLPTGELGRIGLDIFQKNPKVLYALVANLNTRAARPDTTGGGRGGAGGRGGGGAGATIGNELYRTDDGGTTWKKTSETNVAGGKAPYSFNQIRVDPGNDQRVIANSDNMFITEDGGKTWDDRRLWPNGFFSRAFGDFRTMWFDPDDPKRILIGSDGGVSFSFDGGKTADFFPNLKIGEAYAVGVDMDDPYHVYAGFQDHDSWKGPVNTRWGSVTLENWVTVGPGDGMYNVIDPTDSRWAYNTRELNQLGRMDQLTGVRVDIRPPQPPNVDRLRYNWIAPIALSPFDSKTIYAGAQVLFRSKDRGDHWEVISPDLTTNDAAKIGWPSTPYCSITTISESPVTAGTIWIGTDDGKVHVTRNAGTSWTDLTPALTAAGAPTDRWVSRVFASPHNAEVAFVAKTGFRNDDFTPYLYRTTDGGKTFTSISGDLPKAPVSVVVQDKTNANLLIVGNDIGVFVSIDAGLHWSRLKANLPTVAVHDLLIHPRENDLVIGTYGRALWVGDISPLRELTPDVMNMPSYLFDIESKTPTTVGGQGMNYQLNGNKYIQVPNEPDGLSINYYLKTSVTTPVQITIADTTGRQIRQLNGTQRAGLNRVLIGFGGGGRGGGGGGTLAAGKYLVTLDVGGVKSTKPAVVRQRP